MKIQLRTALAVLIPLLLVAGFFMFDKIKHPVFADIPSASPSPAAENTPAPKENFGTVRPLLGTLTIRVPAGIVGTDYWVYVNKHIVSAPPHESLPGGTDKFTQVEIPTGMEFWDQNGLAAKSQDDRISYVRDDVSGSLFQDVVIKLAPGNYSIELMVKSTRGEFPFAVTKSKFEIQLEAGDTQTAVLGLPPDWSTISPAAAALAAPGPPTQETATQLQHILQNNTQRYEQDPIVRALDDVERNFSYTPPLGPTVYVELPEDAGGPRELDAAQIEATINAITATHEYYLDPSERDKWQAAGSNYSAFYDQFTSEVEAYNKSIESLKFIVDKLHQADRK